MKTRLWMSLAVTAAMTLMGTSCNDDWGKSDPPAGNQVYPSLQNVSKITFEDEDGNPAMPLDCNLSVGQTGILPEIVVDEKMSLPVLDTKGGIATMANPMNTVKCQTGVSFTFWVRQPMEVDGDGNAIGQQDVKGALVSFVNQEGAEARADIEAPDYGTFSISADGTITIKTNKANYTDTDPTITDSLYMKPNEWHFMAVSVREDGYSIYVDSKVAVEKAVPEFKDYEIVKFLNHAANVKFGDTNTDPIRVTDLTLYRNVITEKEYKRPRKGTADSGSSESLAPLPDPIYFLDFERGLGEATIQGSGKIIDMGGNFGKVFQNVGHEIRQNFLVLPPDVLMPTGETEELTVTFWVNATNAGDPGSYMWTPIFSAYSDYSPNGNHAPLICCQYRGCVANNMNGADNVGGNWCDYVDANCDQGRVTIRHNDTDWLADHKWHMYTAIFTKTTAAVYFDDELVNSWTIDGVSDGQRCEIFGKAELNYICVGGNQSWWGDPDLGAAFDDIAIYNHALTAEQISTIYSLKEMPNAIYRNNFERGVGEATIQGAGKIQGFGGNFGNAFQNVGHEIRQNFLVLPSDVLMPTGETNELSVSFWVNATNAGDPGSYMWTPIFSAYSDYSPNGNHAPLICCQYRGCIANNMNGADNVGGNWCDYVDANCDQGRVTIRHNDTDWLADHKWHMYTVTFTKTTAAVYFDDELVNSWTIDGMSDGQRCEIFGKPELNFVCLGGNQSWWGDPDLGAAYDDVKIYNKCLTADDVKKLYQLK